MTDRLDVVEQSMMEVRHGHLQFLCRLGINLHF